MLKRSGCQATVQGLGESEKTLDREAGEEDTVRPGNSAFPTSCWSKEGWPRPASPKSSSVQKGLASFTMWGKG